MGVRTAWTGLAALFSTLLGFSLSATVAGGRSSVDASAAAWWVGPLVALAAAVLLVALHLLSELVRRGRNSIRSETDSAREAWRANRGPTASITATVEMVLLAGVLPIGGFVAGGARLAAFAWVIPALLILPVLPFVVANNPAILPAARAGRESAADRLLTTLLSVCALAGVLVAGSVYPLSPEYRLLAMAPAALLATLGLSAILLPDARAALRLSAVLARLSCLAVLVVFALVSVFT